MFTCSIAGCQNPHGCLISAFLLTGSFVLATLPYVILGGVLRVIQDTGMITGDFQFLIVTPPIYFVLFFFTVGMIFLARYLKIQGLIKNFYALYAGAGCMAVLIIVLVLAAWGITHTRIDLFVLCIIPLMAVTATADSVGIYPVRPEMDVCQ